MAEVKNLNGISIRITSSTGTPASFHVVQASGVAVIEISSLKVVHSTLPSSVLNQVIQWAQTRKAALSQEWTRAINGQIPRRIS
ncbi:DUF4160 domain-containing protein [Bradyrhizobium sp. SZCCHNR1018]|uniref:DUF4160 domain-containing protein n=1 Tax=unclassified Bradyrhizobium TaxID=2631580 RepID=UPI0039658938